MGRGGGGWERIHHSSRREEIEDLGGGAAVTFTLTEGCQLSHLLVMLLVFLLLSEYAHKELHTDNPALASTQRACMNKTVNSFLMIHTHARNTLRLLYSSCSLFHMSLIREVTPIFSAGSLAGNKAGSFARDLSAPSICVIPFSAALMLNSIVIAI